MQAARDLRAAGRSVREIGLILGNGKPVSRQTVYRALGLLVTSRYSARAQTQRIAN